LEENPDTAFHLPPAHPALDFNQRLSLLQTHLEPMLNRELVYRGLATDKGGLSTTLVGWVESVSRVHSP
jgi:hypothetical protein